MRKNIALLLLALLLIGLVSCTAENGNEEKNNEVNNVNENGEPAGNESSGNDERIGGGTGDESADGKHEEKFLAVDHGVLNNLVGRKNDYSKLFLYTDDFNHGALCEYYDISKDEYVNFFEDRYADPTLSYPEKRYDSEYFWMQYDEMFSDEPDEQEVFILPGYKWPETRSVLCKPEDPGDYRNRYYKIDWRLIDYVGKDKFDEFYEKNKGTQDFNIVNFIREFDISKEQYVKIIKDSILPYRMDIYPYNPEYLYGTDDMLDLYFKKHPELRSAE